MRFLALQTDKTSVLERFCHDGECVVHWTYYHWMYFVTGIARQIAVTIAIAAISAIALSLGATGGITALVAGIAWLAFALPGIVKSYIDWTHDFFLVTTDKVIMVDQSSFFRQEIKPIHIENIGSVSTYTQWWNLFSFGALELNLKEGEGVGTIRKLYVPGAERLAGEISDVVTRHQRGQTGASLTVEYGPKKAAEQQDDDAKKSDPVVVPVG